MVIVSPFRARTSHLISEIHFIPFASATSTCSLKLSTARSRRRSCGGGWMSRESRRQRSSACGGRQQGTRWGDDSMEVDDVEGPADNESSDDEDTNTERFGSSR